MKPSPRLLYAEDNPLDADLTRAYFTEHAPEFAIEVAGTGQRCLERLRETHFDLLLLDHHLPDMDGLEVLKTLFHAGMPVPVVLVTGVGDEELVVRALRLDAANYVAKQGQYLETLPDLLRGVMEEHRRKLSHGLPAASSPRRILYVESQPMDIELTLRHFAEVAPHFMVEVVRSCTEALARLDQPHAYDLMLVDLRMPEQSGLDFVREVKCRRLPLPPFIIISGKGDEAAAIATLKLGAADYIAKREGYLHRLPHTIEKAIAHQRLSDSNEQLRVELAERQRAERQVRERVKELQSFYSLGELTERPGLALDELYQEFVNLLPASWQYPGITCARIAIGDREYRTPNFAETAWKQSAPIKVNGTEAGRLDVVYLEARPDEAEGPFLKEECQLIAALAIRLGQITARKQAEEELRLHAVIFNNLAEGMHLVDGNGIIRYSNPRMESLLGYGAGELVGRSVAVINAPTDRSPDEIQQEIMRAMLQQGEWRGEIENLRKDGSRLWCYATVTVFDHPAFGRVFLSVHTDITERKRAEAEKEQLQAHLLRSQRLEAIGTLASGIAHDLNNILTPILMAVELLREMISDPEGRNLIGMVESSAARGAEVIKQLLTFARGKPGERVLLPVRHQLHEMDKLMHETFPRNIQTSVHATKDLWPVLGDPTQIHQALLNLCVNARDAMPEGGRLALSAENVTLDGAFTALTPEAKPGAYVCLSVADTGTGIPPEIVDRIFDPFFTTKDIGKGTGLGLATVQGIVHGHGGMVRVDSQVGEGTTFTLYLPATLEATAVAVPAQETLPPRGQGELLLVVDDESLVRTVLRQSLERHGYQVLEAEEGAAALALYGRHRDRIQAVVTDMMMPGLDGPKLVRALRQMDARLPIVGMSGLAERVGVPGLADLNLPVLVNKPFTPVKLLAALGRALAGAGMKKG